jgi:hypothetical protein
MAEPKRIVLPYKELVELMIKKHDLHEGIWGLFARFGLNVANASVEYEGAQQMRPIAVIPLVEIGIQEYAALNEISLDAAVVNPRQKAAKKRRATKKK